MFNSRLALVLAVLPLLAACDSAPKTAPKAPAAENAAAPATASARPASAEAAAPLYGTWAADPGACASAPVSISAARFEGAGRQCDITGLSDNGDGSFAATLACGGSAGSQTVTMIPVFAPSGEGVTLIFPDGGAGTTTLLRCE